MSQSELPAERPVDKIFPGRREAIAAGRCMPQPLGCGGEAKVFTSKSSEREYQISALCQACQDKFFGPAPEPRKDFLPEWKEFKIRLVKRGSSIYYYQVQRPKGSSTPWPSNLDLITACDSGWDAVESNHQPCHFGGHVDGYGDNTREVQVYVD